MVIGAGLTYLLDYTSAVPPMAATQSASQSANTAEQKDKVPGFDFTPLGSEKALGVSDLRGKIIVLNFWASWCAPCVKEFPLFLQLTADYPDDVVFIGLSSDHDLAAMNRFLDKLRNEHPQHMKLDNVLIAHDQNSAVTRSVFQTFRLPETILIDRNGIMREKLIGADWDYKNLKALIEKIDTM